MGIVWRESFSGKMSGEKLGDGREVYGENLFGGSVQDLVKTDTDGQTAFDWLYYYLSQLS